MNKNKKQNINQKETGLIKANLQETNLIIPREYNLKNDVIFKAFFSRPGNEIYLIDFLGALLKTNVRNIEVKDEVSVEQLAVEEKGGRLDLQATVNREMIVNIELQMRNNLNIEERTSFYGAKQMAREAKKGTDYKDIKQTIMINILGYNLFEYDEYVSETVTVLKDHRDHEVIKNMKWYFIELPKFRKKNPDLNNKLDQWLLFIDDFNKGAIKMAEARNKVLKQARRELNYLTGSEAVRRMEELREKWEMDDIAIKNRALEEGRIKEKIEIARNLLKTGMKISKIAEVTGLSEEEIKKIK